MMEASKDQHQGTRLVEVMLELTVATIDSKILLLAFKLTPGIMGCHDPVVCLLVIGFYFSI